MINRIKELRTVGILSQDETLKMTTRMILGEVPRLNKKVNEEITDTEVLTIIKKIN